MKDTKKNIEPTCSPSDQYRFTLILLSNKIHFGTTHANPAKNPEDTQKKLDATNAVGVSWHPSSSKPSSEEQIKITKPIHHEIRQIYFGPEPGCSIYHTLIMPELSWMGQRLAQVVQPPS